MKYIALFSMVLTAACARSVTQAAPPTPSPAQLQQQLQAARSAVQCYSAEIRLTYFGPEGRLRGSANLLVQRPDHLRYELLGPHGGPLMAAVTDGNSMQAVDYKENRFVHGTATPAHLDALLQWAPLHLTPAGWVMLLFGEVDVPAAARVSFDAETRAWLAQWQDGAQTRQVWLDAQTHALRRAVIKQDGTTVSDAQVTGRDAHLLPAALHVQAPREHIDMEIVWRDVVIDPPVDTSLFVLQPSRGLSVEQAN